MILVIDMYVGNARSLFLVTTIARIKNNLFSSRIIFAFRVGEMFFKSAVYQFRAL